MTYNYFESYHGKGPVDGIGGAIKSIAKRAVVEGAAIITNAKDLFNYIKTSQDVKLILPEDVNIREQRQIPLKGCKKARQIFFSKSEIIHRNLGCFCNDCRSGNQGECKHLEKLQTIHRVPLPGREENHGFHVEEACQADVLEDVIEEELEEVFMDHPAIDENNKKHAGVAFDSLLVGDYLLCRFMTEKNREIQYVAQVAEKREEDRMLYVKCLSRKTGKELRFTHVQANTPMDPLPLSDILITLMPPKIDLTKRTESWFFERDLSSFESSLR